VAKGILTATRVGLMETQVRISVFVKIVIPPPLQYALASLGHAVGLIVVNYYSVMALYHPMYERRKSGLLVGPIFVAFGSQYTKLVTHVQE